MPDFNCFVFSLNILCNVIMNKLYTKVKISREKSFKNEKVELKKINDFKVYI